MSRVATWLETAEPTWLDDEDPNDVVHGALLDMASRPEEDAPVPAGLPEGHAKAVKALRRLNWRQRAYLRAFLEGGCTQRGARRILAERGDTPPNPATVVRWMHTTRYVEALTLMKRFYAELAGLDRDAVLIKAGRVLDDALDPKPVLHMGEDTGFRVIDGNVAMRAIEFAGKVNRMLGPDNEGARVTLNLINLAAPDEVKVVATQ